MKIAGRLLLIACGLIVLTAGVLTALSVMDINIGNFWIRGLTYVFEYVPMGLLIGGSFILLGIASLIVGIHKRKQMRFAKVPMGEFGSLDISLGAVDKIVKSVACKSDGVLDVKTRIALENNALSLLLDVVMRPDCNIPDTISRVQEDVRNQLEASAGLSVSGIKTTITNIVAKK